MGAVVDSSNIAAQGSAPSRCAFQALSTQRRVTPYETPPKAPWLCFFAFEASPRLQTLLNGAYTRSDRVWRNVTAINRVRLSKVAQLPYRGDHSRSGAPRVRR